MKTLTHTTTWRLAVAVASLTALVQGQALASVLPFSDNFNSGASPLWGNESGGWVAAGGVYAATAHNNAPVAFSSLPFSLTDFSFDVDVNSVTDGGIWLRSTPAPGTTFGIEGVLLELKNPNFGYANSICWQTTTDGNTISPLLGLTFDSYTGSNIHLHIAVSGNTYQAFVNGSVNPITSLTTSAFASGQVALYDFSSQSYDNVLLQAVPEPSAWALMGLSAVAMLVSRRRR